MERWRNRWCGSRLAGAALCAAFLGVFVLLSWTASKGKSPTYDESLHAAAGFAARRLGDFRADPEGSALWKMWAILPHGRAALKLDTDNDAWAGIPRQRDLSWRWCNQVLYRTEGNDGAAFVQRSRAMMLALGVVLGLLICAWSWKMGGAAAAVTAAALYGLDPNFIAHAPLVKNDVPFAMVLFAVVFSVWLLGRRMTWGRIAAVCLLCGAAVNVKFSALVIGPIVAALLLAHAMDPAPWRFGRRELARRRSKVLAAVLVCLAAAATSYGMVWATYGFRFGPAADPSIRLDTNEVVKLTADLESRNRKPQINPKDWKPGVVVSAALFLERHRALPQPWLYGLLYTRASAIRRPAFLLGERGRGWAWYFPLAMALKTPVATIAACAAAGVLLALRRRRWGDRARRDEWTGLCLLLPVMVYGLLSVTTRLNLGIRHVLPLYPFFYVAAGTVASRLYGRWPRPTAIGGAILALGLAGETIAAYPHYIAFFNGPAACAGRIRLLGDSNLDWGQDLPLLAEWQRKHPDRKLYLCYFGSAHPGFYGIGYTALMGGDDFTTEGQMPKEPGVLAFSATHVQGIYLDGKSVFPIYQKLVAGKKPIAVLGESIYLYEFRGR